MLKYNKILLKGNYLNSLFITFALLIINIDVSAGSNQGQNSKLVFKTPLSWKEKSFHGQTNYNVIIEGKNSFLVAQCNETASVLYMPLKVDLTKTPILRWSWKIDQIHHGLDDISKNGDDYAARIYVIYKGTLPWDIFSINYVWANKQPKGEVWTNAHTHRARMIAQESGEPVNKNKWQIEERNVLMDFKHFFNKDVKQIHGVAIMTDCDNGGRMATGYYRDIKFLSVE